MKSDMKKVCPICEKRPAKRHCPRQDNDEICTLCCVEERGPDCAGCTHYAVAQQYRASRRGPATLPDGHFIAELNPEVETAVNHAMDLAERGKLDKAWPEVKRLLREHPGNHTVLFAEGTLHAIQAEHGKAIECFDRAIAIFPYFVEAHFNRAVSYQKQLDVCNAIRAFRKVVEVGDPKEPEVKKAQSFLDDMAETIRRNDGVDLDAYLESQVEFDRAYALMERGEWLSALDGFRAAAAKNGRNAPIHGNMGLCYAKLGHKAKALAALDRALELDPDYGPAKTNRRAVERMEEGRPLDIASFVSTNWSRERFERRQADGFGSRLKRLLGRDRGSSK